MTNSLSRDWNADNLCTVSEGYFDIYSGVISV